MEKLVIRRQPIPCISSILIRYGHSPSDFAELAEREEKDWLLRTVFGETQTYVELATEYRAFLAGAESDQFVWMYRLDANNGVVIDRNICLYHCDHHFGATMQACFGWVYMEYARYMADSWWYSDDEILHDLQTLSTLEFVCKYKGYIG